MSEVKLYNDDVRGFVLRIDRFLQEMNKSQSANITEFVSFDVDRLKSYLQVCEAYLSWVSAAPQLDLPETHPLELVNPPMPELPTVENPMIDDVLRLMVRLRGEALRSQSSRRASGLVSFDLERFKAILGKIGAYLDDFVATVNPVDLPESSPSQPITGPGK